MKKQTASTPPLSKLIIENRTNIAMEDVLALARNIVAMGRISNMGRQYCFLASYTIEGEEYHLVSDINKKSDRLIFYKRQ
jgi:hypothetical protein